MNGTTTASLLCDQMFSDGGENVFAVLDGASVPDLPHLLWEEKADRVCLWRGELGAARAAVAPYLVRLDREAHLTGRLLSEGWGHHWGIFATAPAEVGLPRARNHLRKLLRARLPDGRGVLFRFYDPRVLRIYLPTCDAGELSEFFGPLATFVFEDDPPEQAVRFRFHEGELRDERVSLAAEGRL